MLNQVGRVLIIAAAQEADLSTNLVDIASNELSQKHLGFEVIKVSRVQEIHAAASIMLEGNEYAGIIVLGAVIVEDYKLEATHIYSECLRGMTDIVMYYSIPLGMGVFIAENPTLALKQAANNTKAATNACAELLFLKNQFDDFKNDASFSYQN